MHTAKIFIVLVTIFFNQSDCLKCYTCSVGENDLDQRCVTDPASVETGSKITICNKKYCTSIRQDYIDPKGKVASMIRTCEDKPAFLNTVQEDGSHRIYYRACQEDLCNDGTGYSTGNGIINDQDDGGVIYAKGVDVDSGIIHEVNLALLVISFLCVYANHQ